LPCAACPRTAQPSSWTTVTRMTSKNCRMHSQSTRTTCTTTTLATAITKRKTWTTTKATLICDASLTSIRRGFAFKLPSRIHVPLEVFKYDAHTWTKSKTASFRRGLKHQ
ncbi:hypothetical protein AAVH_38385, partial [Aphelenchoides avenae]